MRKIFALILSFAMILSLAACGSTDEGYKPSTNPIESTQGADSAVGESVPNETTPPETVSQQTAPAETDPPETTPIEVSITETVIYESEDFKITVTGFDNTDRYNVQINMLVENHTGKNIALSADHFVVNGIYLWCDLYIKAAAQTKANGSLEISRSDMELVGIEQIATILTKDARLVDTDEYDTIADFSFELSTSIANGYEQEIDESGTVVLEQDGIMVKYRGIGKDRYGRDELSFFVKNTTEKDVIVTCDNVSVNDFTIYGDLLVRAYANTVCYDYMDFLTSELEDNGIESIESVTFNFRVYEQETYIDILESETIEIIINESSVNEETGTISLGNFTFDIPDGFVVAGSEDTYFAISSSDGECAIGLTATDISALDEEAAKVFLPISHNSFINKDTTRSSEDIVSGAVADFEIEMDYYLNSSNSSVNLVGTFTDSWYAYTVKFVCKQDSNMLKEYVDLFAEFCVYADYNGAEPRFDFIQLQ